MGQASSRVLETLQKFNWHCVQCVYLRDYLNKLLCSLCECFCTVISPGGEGGGKERVLVSTTCASRPKNGVVGNDHIPWRIQIDDDVTGRARQVGGIFCPDTMR